MHTLNLNIDRWSLVEDNEAYELTLDLKQVLATGVDISNSTIIDPLDDWLELDWDTKEYVH